MTHEHITLQRRDAVATVVLDRPEKLNAMTKPMWRRLGEVFRELAGDDSLRCVLLRGAGGRAFSPGNDIGEFETERADVAQARAYGATTGTAQQHAAQGLVPGQLMKDHAKALPHRLGHGVQLLGPVQDHGRDGIAPQQGYILMRHLKTLGPKACQR